MAQRVLTTDKANKIIDELRGRYGDLMFHQSGGCCDGSQPMCFEDGDFKVGSNDVWLCDVYGCPFFMNRDQFEYWQYSELTLDVTKGRGSSFSLEIPMGIRFITRSRLMSMEEYEQLAPTMSGEAYLEKQRVI